MTGAQPWRDTVLVVELRAAVAGDAELLTEIYIDSWNQGFGHLLGRRELTRERVDRMRVDLADQAGDWTVAELDGALVGFVAVGPSRDPLDPLLGEVHTIAVDPLHWRQGVGHELMAHALDRLQQRWSRAVLWTPANYARGHEFYRATGWRPLDRSRAGGAEVAFGCDL